MSKHNIFFIGLDTHKVFTEVAYIEDQRGAQPIHHGRIPTDKKSVKTLVRKFESKYPMPPYTLSMKRVLVVIVCTDS